MRRILREVTLTGVLLALSLVALTEENQGTGTNAQTDYAIVVTGGELLRGVYADGHTLFLTRTLAPLGCRCVGVICVGDNREDLRDALIHTEGRAKLVVVTGGLGPTDDDITRETLSDYTGIPLREHPDALEAMMKRFGVRRRDDLRRNLLRQTLTPEKGTFLENPTGTAAGLVFDDGERVVVALPGPPRELQPMVKKALIPYLSERFGTRPIGCSLTFRFVGIGESSIDKVMHERLDLPADLMISSLFEYGRVDLTLSLPGDTARDRERLAAIEEALRKEIGEFLYSSDGSTLEESVVGALTERQASLVTAEVGSGGAIAASLNQTRGMSQTYLGGVAAASERALLELLQLSSDLSLSSGETTKQRMISLACRICERNDSDWALVVSQRIEADDGSLFVWLVIGSQVSGFDTHRVSTRGHGETGQARLVNEALERLLRRLLKK